MKWHSDIDTKVTHDRRRNQLSRVIENAIAFSGPGIELPDAVYVTLVTPAFYRDEHPRSRLYWYKYHDYKSDPKLLENDLRNCRLQLRDYELSEVIDRLKVLHQNWCTFEDLIELLGNGDFSSMVRELNSLM